MAIPYWTGVHFCILKQLGTAVMVAAIGENSWRNGERRGEREGRRGGREREREKEQREGKQAVKSSGEHTHIMYTVRSYTPTHVYSGRDPFDKHAQDDSTDYKHLLSSLSSY